LLPLFAVLHQTPAILLDLGLRFLAAIWASSLGILGKQRASHFLLFAPCAWADSGDLANQSASLAVIALPSPVNSELIEREATYLKVSKRL
jgi:hypothetical protein